MYKSSPTFEPHLAHLPNADNNGASRAESLPLILCLILWSIGPNYQVNNYNSVVINPQSLTSLVLSKPGYRKAEVVTCLVTVIVLVSSPILESQKNQEA